MEVGRKMYALLVILVLLLALAAVGCGGAINSMAPDKADPKVPEAPAVKPTLPILLAGQSNAVILRDREMPDSLNVTRGGAGIEWWLPPDGVEWRDLERKARLGPCAGFVWWQGEHDFTMDVGDYAGALWRILNHLKAAGVTRFVLVEPWNYPGSSDSNPALAMQDLALTTPGAVFLRTNDLEHEGNGDAHFAPAAYAIVRDRVYRALSQ